MDGWNNYYHGNYINIINNFHNRYLWKSFLIATNNINMLTNNNYINKNNKINKEDKDYDNDSRIF